MKVILDIPKEFENHFKNDRFSDSLQRLKADARFGDGLAGKYETELADMLIKAFKFSEIENSNSSTFKKKVVNMLKYIRDLLADSTNDRDQIIKALDKYIGIMSV